MPEVLPSTSTPISVRYSESYNADSIERRRVESGPVADIMARRDTYRLTGMFGPGISLEEPDGEGVASDNVEITSMQLEAENGKASLTLVFVEETDPLNDSASSTDAVEGASETVELSALDVVQDIRFAAYFKTLTSSQKQDVRKHFDNNEGEDSSWVTLQKTLFRHYANGVETYLDTAFEVRRTYITSSTAKAKVAAENINTVQELPSLGRLNALVGALPDGEWLKKPTTCVREGRRGWRVTEHYQWAAQWSVIYGGTYSPTS